MKIEICIPAFNEERIISESVNAVARIFREAGREALITVSDNASTDRTASIARSIKGVSVLSTSIQGKGAAVVAVARRSSADFFGFIDADLSVDPTEIISFLSLLERDSCDIVIGSRLIDKTIVDRGMLRTFLSKMFNALRKIIVGVKAEDTQCGLKLMNARGREVLAECLEKGWFFDMEFLVRAERAGMRIQEVPIHWREHRFIGRDSKLNLFRDCIGAFHAMFRIRRRVMQEKRLSALKEV